MVSHDVRAARARAARIRQSLTIATTAALAMVASSLWKPLIEQSSPFTGRHALLLAVAVAILCLTVAFAPYGERHD